MRGVELESRAPFTEGGDRWIEHLRLLCDFTFGAQGCESLAIDAFNRPFLVAEINHAARNKARPQSWLELFETAKESIDRTTGRARRRLIDCNSQKASVPPVPAGGERRTVRVPLREKTIDFAEKQIGRSLVEIAIRTKYPRAGVVG